MPKKKHSITILTFFIFIVFIIFCFQLDFLEHHRVINSYRNSIVNKKCYNIVNFEIPIRGNSELSSVQLEINSQNLYLLNPSVYVDNKMVWKYNDMLGQILIQNMSLENQFTNKKFNLSLPLPLDIKNAYVQMYLESYNKNANLQINMGNYSIFDLNASDSILYHSDFMYSYPAGLIPISVDVGYFDNNGIVDIILLNDYGVYAILNIMSHNPIYTTFCNFIDTYPMLVHIEEDNKFQCLVLLPNKLVRAKYNNDGSWGIVPLIDFGDNRIKLGVFDQYNNLYGVFYNNNIVKINPYTKNISYICNISHVKDILPCDINDDSLIDLLVASDEGVYLIRNMNNTYDVEKIISSPANKVKIIRNAAEILLIYRHNNTWCLWFDNNTRVLCMGQEAVISDIDGDSLEDIIVSNKSKIDVYLNENNLSFHHVQTLDIEKNIVHIISNDVDDDFDQDIIVGDQNRFEVLLNKELFLTVKLDLKSVLDKIISADGSGTYTDVWGNILMNTTLSIRYQNFSNLTLQILNITYKHPIILNITEYVKNYMNNSEQESQWYYVPINITADNILKINYSYRIFYDYAPPFCYGITPLYVYEDNITSQHKIIDLRTYFWDDKPESLQFYVYGGNEYVQGYIEDGHYFSVRAAPNWYGNATFRIKAVDSDGFYVYSNPFNITVLPVDDAPCVLPLSDMKIRANKTYYLDLSEKIWDIDSPSLNITTSDPSNVVPLSNYTLKIRYSAPGNYTVMIYVSDGNLTNQTSLNITVVPYSAPLWVKEIPDIVTYKNEPLDEQNSPINIRDFVEDPDTPVESLAFEIVSQSDPHIDVSISPSGKVLVNPEENYVGTSTVVVKVSDSQYSDTTSFRVVVRYKNYPPVYLGGLSSKYYVKEDTVWKVNLAEHFDDLETPSDRLLYRASSPEIIINGTYAYWMPKHGDKSIYNLTFYAYDNASDYAVSDPITLVYVEVNDPPVYIGGLTDITIKESEELILNLSNYFTDEETPNSLIFGCNVSDIVINGTIAEYSGSKSLKNVVFYAIDPQNDSLIAYSNPINITVIPKNKPPKAYIDEIRIIQGGVILRGHGVDEDGSIVKYEWYSSKDGFLGNAEYLQVKLSPGKHVISFRVMDNNGTWSNYTYREIIIPEFNYGQIILYSGISLIICGSGLIAATYLSIWGWRRRTAISG